MNEKVARTLAERLKPDVVIMDTKTYNKKVERMRELERQELGRSPESSRPARAS